MIESSEQWLAEIRQKLAEALDALDANSETLIAAHVAAAIECVRVRIEQV